MTNRNSRLINTAFDAQRRSNGTTLVGTVHAIKTNYTGQTEPLYDVIIHDRRNETYGGNAGYIIRDCASAVPVQVGHRVFVIVVNGDLHQGGYITGFATLPKAQRIELKQTLRPGTYLPLAEKNFDASAQGLQDNPKPWFVNNIVTKPNLPSVNLIPINAVLGAANVQINAAKDGLIGDALRLNLINYDGFTYPAYLHSFSSLTGSTIDATYKQSFDNTQMTEFDSFAGLSDAERESFRRIPDEGRQILCTAQKMEFFAQFLLNRLVGLSIPIYMYASAGGSFFAGVSRELYLHPRPEAGLICFARVWVELRSRTTGRSYYGRSNVNTWRFETPFVFSKNTNYTSSYGGSVFGVGLSASVVHVTTVATCDVFFTDHSWNVEFDMPDEVGNVLDVYVYTQMQMPHLAHQNSVAAASLILVDGWSLELTELGIGSDL